MREKKVENVNSCSVIVHRKNNKEPGTVLTVPVNDDARKL